MIPHHIVSMCRVYAQLEVQARESVSLLRMDPDLDRTKLGNRQRWVQKAKPQYAKIYRAAARMLYDMAPAEALPHLDAVKKVLEIDTDAMNVDMVLLRASLEPDTTEDGRTAAERLWFRHEGVKP